MTKETEAMLHAILNTEPDKRLTIDGVRSHDWFIKNTRTESTGTNKGGLYVGYSKIEVDEEVLAMLSQYDIDPEYARKQIESNKHSHITTCYYLLMKKHGRHLYV